MINRIVLIGRLTADPETRYTQSGIAVTNFRLAVERNFKDASGEKQTDFINVVAWRKLAELVVQYLVKGNMAGVEGSMQMEKYEDRDGKSRTTYKVQADSVQFLKENRETQDQEVSPPPPASHQDEDSELPF